jgi:hypothetical protein
MTSSKLKDSKFIEFPGDFQRGYHLVSPIFLDIAFIATNFLHCYYANV